MNHEQYRELLITSIRPTWPKKQVVTYTGAYTTFRLNLHRALKSLPPTDPATTDMQENLRITEDGRGQAIVFHKDEKVARIGVASPAQQVSDTFTTTVDPAVHTNLNPLIDLIRGKFVTSVHILSPNPDSTFIQLKTLTEPTDIAVVKNDKGVIVLC